MGDQPVVRRDPAAELGRLQCRIPYRDQPVRVWVAWFQQQADLWDEVAVVDPSMTDTAVFCGEYLRCKAKELGEQYQPDDRWPGAKSW